LTILVLGGTAEGRALTEALGKGSVLSLAGVTQKPVASPHRVGGFGGVEGLVAYLRAEGVKGAVDATHPFAAQMSLNIFGAATALKLPLLRLERPPWPQAPTWKNLANLNEAAKAIPSKARVFLSTGRQSLGPFIARDDVWFLTRSIEPPAHQPPHGETVLQRPPFSLADELALIRHHKITHLVSKNAGGDAVYAKIVAATKLGVQVIMVKRPRVPEVLTVETVAEAVKWVKNLGE